MNGPEQIDRPETRPAQNEMWLEVASRSENVGLVRVCVATFAAQLDFTLSELEEIKVAVSEAVSNAIIHGYRGGEGRIRVGATAEDGELRLEITDWGCGIADLEAARQPNVSSDPERMGLGFMFMESLMDGFEVLSEPGRGTTVRLAKRARKPMPAA